jgi:hypothetical protein
VSKAKPLRDMAIKTRALRPTDVSRNQLSLEGVEPSFGKAYASTQFWLGFYP